jgi:hypothetical protein
MQGEHMAHHSVVALNAEGTGDVLRDARTIEAGMAAMSSGAGPWGPGLRRKEEEKSRWYGCGTSA